MKKRLLLPLAGFVAAALAFTALLYACGAWLRPDVKTSPPAPSPEKIAAIEAARRAADFPDFQNPPVITQRVDYAEGPAAAWYPKNESPILAELVREGKLPPVAERVGPEPIVMQGVEGLGRYGGTWHRLASSIKDMEVIFWRLSYMNLVRWSPLGKPLVPNIAKSWEASPDNRAFTITLRRGVRWSDGEPMTADDIVWWYENEVRYFKARPRVLRTGRGLGRVERVDQYSVRFVFDHPNPLFIEKLAAVNLNYEEYSDYLTPAHYLRRYHPELGDKELIERTMRALKLASPVAVYMRMKQPFNPDHPRLWPWVYRRFAPNTPQVFVRNPYFCGVDTAGNQLPYLDRLVMDVRPSNLFGLTASTGQVSMQDRHMRYEDHVLLMSEAERNGYQVYHWFPASRSLFTIYPVINRRVDPKRPETKLKSELLNDRRFRQALSLAINRRDIIHAEFNSHGVPAQIDPGPGSDYHSDVLFKSYTEYDPARANALLDELGLTRRDSEGYRTFRDGTRMVWFLNMTEYTGNAPAQFIVDDWARVGIRCIQRIRSRALYTAEKASLEHDMNVWMGESEFTPLIEPRNFVPTYGESFYAPSFGKWYERGGLNGDPDALRTGAVEPPPDHPLRRSMELLELINASPDLRTRQALFQEVQAANAENVWHISICTPPPQLVVVKNGFRNVPRNAIFGAAYNTPGNAGMETYFQEEGSDPPAVEQATKEAIVATTVEPSLRDVDKSVPEDDVSETIAAPPATLLVGKIVRILIVVAAALGLALIALRHPFIGRRVLLMIPTLAVVSVVVFLIVQIPPGDFASSRIMELEVQGFSGNDQRIEDMRKNFHLDESLTSRYLRWIGVTWFTTFKPQDAGLLQGSLGLSMEHNRSVNHVIGDRLMLTVLVSLATILFTWALAVPIGIYSAVRQYSPGDYFLTLVGFLGMSVPSFLLAVVFMYLSNRWFGIQISGLFSPEFATMPGWNAHKVIDLAQHIWLPVVVLGFGGTAGMIRVMRANLLDELKKPYVTTARAKGVRPLKLLFKYPVRLALNPFISGLGSLFPQLVSGGAIVAMVLSLPMIGPTMLDALLTEDVYLAGSMLMVMSLLGVVGTLVSDLLLLWLDPRIRLGAGAR